MSRLSIVVPVFFNEASLPTTIPRLLALGEMLPGYDLELVFVEDGSGDDSLRILLDARREHPGTLKVVKLTRNFGSMAAIQAGFAVATGDCVGVIAADLQDPPELFIEMVRHWEKGVKAVFAVRSGRREPPAKRFFASLYYSLLRRMALPGYPRGGFDFLLADRQVVDEVTRIAEKNTNLMSLIFWLGHHAVMLPYVRGEGTGTGSRWTLAKKVKLFIDSFVAFSYVPIRLLSVVGLLLAAGSFLYGGVILVAWWTSSIEVKGWTAMMIVLTFTAGMQITMLGVLGEYVWRILDETRRRPPYVIDEIFDQ